MGGWRHNSTHNTQCTFSKRLTHRFWEHNKMVAVLPAKFWDDLLLSHGEVQQQVVKWKEHTRGCWHQTSLSSSSPAPRNILIQTIYSSGPGFLSRKMTLGWKTVHQVPGSLAVPDQGLFFPPDSLPDTVLLRFCSLSLSFWILWAPPESQECDPYFTPPWRKEGLPWAGAT